MPRSFIFLSRMKLTPEQQIATAKERGRSAYFLGYGRSSNPYHVNGLPREAWFAAWDEAKASQ